MENIMNYKSRMSYLEIEPVLDELKSIPYAIIKGEPLSLAAYNSIGKRISSDVDILISRENISLLENLLIKYGFNNLYYDNKNEQRRNRVLMLSASHQVSPFHKKKGIFDLCVDINFDIFWGEYSGKRIDINYFLEDTIDIEIYNVAVKVLKPIKALIQLILHHYKEMNSLYHLSTHNCIKYDMFKDVYNLLKNNIDEISVEKLYTISEKIGVIPYVFYILYFTNSIFNDPEMEKYIKTFETQEGVELLNVYGLAKSEKKKWRIDFKTRLETENIYEVIRDELTAQDVEKINYNRKIFR